jgi:hypothetical protein
VVRVRTRASPMRTRPGGESLKPCSITRGVRYEPTTRWLGNTHDRRPRGGSPEPTSGGSPLPCGRRRRDPPPGAPARTASSRSRRHADRLTARPHPQTSSASSRGRPTTSGSGCVGCRWVRRASRSGPVAIVRRTARGRGRRGLDAPPAGAVCGTSIHPLMERLIAAPRRPPRWLLPAAPPPRAPGAATGRRPPGPPRRSPPR